MAGCKDCMHDKLQGSDHICDLRPFDMQTLQQRAIVNWLTQFHVEPFTSPGCPSFVDYRSKESNT